MNIIAWRIAIISIPMSNHSVKVDGSSGLLRKTSEETVAMTTKHSHTS
ncbi:hypothetical protein VIBHAR_05765 [Vibrio campbellii ATCC BAA-1116]|uniref:Uncharacterized protein n=1 Tax=Vibrio campbellii (strain ATCC BAA-1116) TaxID=2902295 RepID=A7N8I8_VIBC1|nr:hypothetical protein VIBHAR_05765 [Vibrio campbellii ATCC BAA-1116]